MKKKTDVNPKNPDEKDREKVDPVREDPAKAQETDQFSEQEQKNIVRMVMDDYQLGLTAYQAWKDKKVKDLQQINAEKPSVIEALTKKAWMSDRNLGLCPGVLDIYQATLMATCYNPDTLHFKATEENDIDNKDNLERFAKWMVGPKEVNLEPEVDDFIQNRVGLGSSFFEIDWDVKYEWCDKRIPKYSKESTGRKPRLLGYDIKTEKRRFERGRICNIDDIDDVVLPAYGKNIQELSFAIRVIHLMLSDIEDMEKRRMIVAIKDAQRKNKHFQGAPDAAASKDSLSREKADALGIMKTVDPDGRNYPLDVLKWYGYIEKNGRRERYRILVEPTTETFLSGKPLRKITRTGKIPIVGGPFRRVPGQIRGGSLTGLIAPIINAINNNYNQTSDFQTIQNLPFGFADFEEGFTESLYEVEPGKIYDVDGNPSEKVYFPNLQRSLAWSYQDKQFLLEMLERLTGAASYFLTSKSSDTTATRDTIVEQKGETKFGIWVRRIQADIVEAINMCVSLYQDWAPPNLGKRVLGDDGKQIIRNLSIDTLRGNYDAYMVPDLTSGSKAYERQIMLWAAREVNQGCVWMNPQVNPRGNWLLWKDTMFKQGIENPEYYLPPMPKVQMDADEEAKAEWTRFMQGDSFDPPEGVSPAAVRHYMTHMVQLETQLHELDEEYRANFEHHLFVTKLNYDKFMQQVARQQQEMQMASQMAQALEKAGMKPGMMAPAMAQPAQGAGLPAGDPGVPVMVGEAGE